MVNCAFKGRRRHAIPEKWILIQRARINRFALWTLARLNLIHVLIFSNSQSSLFEPVLNELILGIK